MLVISADVGLITSLRRGLQTEPFCIIPGGILPCFPACWPPCAEIPTRRWRRASAPAACSTAADEGCRPAALACAVGREWHTALPSVCPVLFSGVLCTSLGLLWTSP